MKNRILVSFIAVLLLVVMLAGCSQSATPGQSATPSASAKPVESSATETASGGADTDAKPAASVPKFEDINFPDTLPAVIPMADESLYAYDDMTERYKIEILSHHYGTPTLPANEDPVAVYLGKKFNMDITFTTVLNDDRETTIATRFAAADYPDLTMLWSREYGFSFSDQGLLLDARQIYPYMPQTSKFTTKNMITWSTNKANGEIPFTTKYGIQDGVWGFAIRGDWLEKFGMQPPTTKAALLEYAKACATKDPDGNGKADTYFMSAAGAGKSWGMMGGFESMFGNPASHVDNGTLSHPYFNGSRKDYLMFIKELYDAGTLSPDWYTIDWETNKSYTMNDKLGMVWYPAGALYAEYTGAKDSKGKGDMNFDVWKYWAEVPIEGGKYNASGNPGYLLGFAKDKFTDEGKLKRVAHMVDSMVMGGANYFQTIQGGTTEIFEEMGITVEEPRGMTYTDDRKAFYINALKNPNAKPWEAGGLASLLGPWQVFGLSVSYQITDPNSPNKWDAKHAMTTNEAAIVVNGYDRWPNDGLLVTLTGSAAEASTSNADWINAQEYAFATGARSFDEWDAFTTEWLNRGGKEIVKQTAEGLGVPVPDYAK